MKKVIITVLAILLVVALGSSFFLFKNNIPGTSPLSPQDKTTAKEKPVVTCAHGDEECISKNANTLANQLTGDSVEFAKHQCDGPRACPTPAPADIEAATTAIRTYAKDSKLQVIPVTGTTPAGSIYYCAKDNRCWQLEAKTNKVLSFVDGKKSPTPSPSKREK